MMKVEFTKPSPTLQKQMNKKELLLDEKKMKTYNKDIANQFGQVEKSFQKISSILNKMVLKRSFNEKGLTLAMQCAKKCASQAQAANSFVNNYELKYSDDLKTIVIQDLNNRITHLEEVIASINK